MSSTASTAHVEPVEPEEAAEELRAALAEAGITLPSLGVSACTAFDRAPHVELGGAHTNVVLKLAEVVRRGCGR